MERKGSSQSKYTLDVIQLEYSFTVQKRSIRERSANVWQCSQPLNISIDRITNQRFGRRRSRFDDTFKWSGVPVESKIFQSQESATCILN